MYTDPLAVAAGWEELVAYMVYGPDSEKNNIGKRLPPLWDDFLARRHEIADGIQTICYGVVRQERDDDDRFHATDPGSVYLYAMPVEDQ